MPNGHNGYYDTMLNLGYVGLALLVVFIIATLHGIGRVAERDPVRAWLVLSLALFVILYNFIESLLMHGFEAAEIGRCWGPFPPRGAAHSSTIQRPGTPGSSLGARGRRPRTQPPADVIDSQSAKTTESGDGA